jgi:hypothetical protein
MHPRDGVSAALWKKVKEDTLVYIGTPTDHEDRPARDTKSGQVSGFSGRLTGRISRRRQSSRRDGKIIARAEMRTATMIKEIKPGERSRASGRAEDEVSLTPPCNAQEFAGSCTSARQTWAATCPSRL